ncbi:choice-of-anchor A family protein [Streptomyces sp. NPDC051183]|uniref:choice-of-anchor A family protein n=1 Tax=Streptomyces sp. NPDC051183 TaxID=3155165 RepID=UPI003414897F
MRTSAVLAVAGAAAGSLALLPAAPASAAPRCGDGNPLGAAGAYAEFVEGDSTRYSDSEGAVAVGGEAKFGDSASGHGFSVGDKLSPGELGALPGGKSLVVGGRLNANQVVISKGEGVYRELKDTSRRGGFAVDGRHAKGSSPVDFAKEFAALRSASRSWAQVRGNGTVARPEGGKALLLTGADAELNVFSVDASDLQQTDRISLKVPAGSTTLVNVLGSSYDMIGSPLYGVELWDPQTGEFVLDDYAAGSAKFKDVRSKLLWNFPQATSVKKNHASWPGTLLAPDAAVELGGKGAGPGHVNGGVIAKRLTSVPGAETHQMTFAGCLPATGGGGGGGGGTAQPIPPAPRPTPVPPQPSTPATGSPAGGTGGAGGKGGAGDKPSATPSAPPGKASSTAQPEDVSGRLAATGGSADSRIVLGAVAALAIGGACVASAAVRRRASRR